MRKISIQNHWFMKLGDEPDAFAKLSEMGFEACDYAGLTNIHGELHSMERKMRLEILEKVRKNAAHAGIEIYQTHGPWVWPTGNETPEGRTAWMNYMKACIEGCEIMECKNLVVHPIMPYGATSEPDEQNYIKINHDFWEQLLPFAEKHGVRLLLENMPFLKQSISSPKSIADFVDTFDSEYFKACFDTGHCLVWDTSLADGVGAMGERICAFHIHDNDAKSDRHDCPWFGVGDWDGFKQAIRVVDKSVPISLECGPKRLPQELWENYIGFLANMAKKLCE